MAGRPKHRARVLAALARGERPPTSPAAANPERTRELAEERARLEKLVSSPHGFENIRCTERVKRGNRTKNCPNWAVWGLDKCIKHGGLSPELLEERKARLAQMVEFIDPNELLVIGRQILHADLWMCLDAKGKFLPVADWPPEVRAAIKSVKVVNFNADPTDGKTEEVVEITFIDKGRHLELLMREAGQLVDKMQLTGKVTHEHEVKKESVDALREGLERAAQASSCCPHCGKDIHAPAAELPEARQVEGFDVADAIDVETIPASGA